MTENTQEERFRELSKKWKSDTRFISNVSRRAMDLSYQRIISMGEAAVPFILKDLAENGPDDWFWALTVITGENPITEDIAGNMNAMTEAWLQWGTMTGYLRDCLQKTSSASPVSL